MPLVQKQLKIKFFMTKLIILFFIIISLESWAKADDIRDFEIEGFSIGESLLNHYSNEDITNSLQMKYPLSDKYIKYQFKLNNSEYDNISFHIKKNDTQYKITEISGGIFFTKNFSKCENHKNKVKKDIKIITKNLKEDSYRFFYKTIEDGKSFADVVEFKYPNGDLIRMWCVNWSNKVEKSLNYADNFSISLTPFKHMNWINKEAY